MAPGAFSILAPFLRRKVKKYERLETEDPEKKRQEATLEELTRINMKIVSVLIFSNVCLFLETFLKKCLIVFNFLFFKSKVVEKNSAGTYCSNRCMEPNCSS